MSNTALVADALHTAVEFMLLVMGTIVAMMYDNRTKAKEHDRIIIQEEAVSMFRLRNDEVGPNVQPEGAVAQERTAIRRTLL